MPYSDEFPLKEGVVYLNHAGVSPWPRRSVEAVESFARENMTQGSLNYPHWMDTEQQLRERLGGLINAPAETIALVKSTSEALSFVASGISWHAGENVVSSAEEFISNRIVWESLAPLGVELREVDLSGTHSPEQALIERVDENTRLISISSVQYGSGIRIDLEKLGQFCHQRGILFCVDAIQSVGAEPLDVDRAHIDLLAADGHKWMLGPEGLGMFYCREQLRDQLRLSEFGWHMIERIGDYVTRQWQPADHARRFECGSPNLLGAHALNASLSLLYEVGIEEVHKAITERVNYLFDALAEESHLEILTQANPARRLGIFTFRCRDGSTSQCYRMLRDKGIFCAERGGGVRLSPHFYTPYVFLDYTIDALKRPNG